MHNLLSFLRLTIRQKFFFTSALVCLPVCQMVINFFSFSCLIRVFGLAPRQVHPTSLNNQSNLGHVTEIARMTKIASNCIPLFKFRCLAQALTVLCLVGSFRKDCVLYLGTDYNSAHEKLSAHAWISYGDQIILGYEERAKYHHIASFN